MSRPGFPINMNQSVLVHNTYRNVAGTEFPSVDAHYSRGRREDKVGDNTPGWPAVKRTNSYERYIATWNQDPCTVNGSRTNGDTFSGEWSNSFGFGFNPWETGPFNQASDGALLTETLMGKLIDQIQSHRVNLGEVLHTRAQAASMVASTANRLAGAFMALKRGNFAGAGRYLGGLSPRSRRNVRASNSGATSSGVGGIPEQWLALQYGWKPALQDVYNSCETVRRAWNDGGELFTVKAHGQRISDKVSFVVGPDPPHGPSKRYQTGKRTVHGNASCTFGVDSNFGSSLSQLGITNPASLAWELLPYSFVVDWFIPIGSFLERLDYSRGLVFKYGWMNLKYEQSLDASIEQSHSVSGDITCDWSGGKGSGKAMYFVRGALTGFPSPPIPRFKDPFSLTHVANALSLLATAFKGHK